MYSVSWPILIEQNFSQIIMICILRLDKNDVGHLKQIVDRQHIFSLGSVYKDIHLDFGKLD